MQDEERVIQHVMACVDLDADERTAYLDEHCASAALRDEVESWLNRDVKTWMPRAEELATAVESLQPLEDVLQEPGDLIDRFELVERIAEGGQGVVWRARQKDIDRDAAVKILRPHRKGSEASDRFHRETAVLARVSHPAIAQIYARGAQEIDSATELPWFAMEFIPGRTTLIEYCNGAQATMRERLDLFLRVCDAVAHSHALGVIHRDLKPDNILVDPSGHPKVIDFGAARDLRSEEALTHEGAIIGTLEWASPEQIQSDPDNDVGSRTDVYALGAVLHLLLTNHKLVTLNSLDEVRAKIIERTPRPASRFLSSLPRELDWIIGRATEPDPSRRYADVNALIADIRRYLEGQPIVAAPVSLGYTLSRVVHRHFALTAVTFVSLILLSALGIFGWKTALAERNLREREREAREQATEAKGEARDSLVGALLADAEAHEATGQWSAAIDALRNALLAGADDPLAVHLSIARNLIANLEHAEAAEVLDRASELPRWEDHRDTHALLRGLTALVDEDERDLFSYYIEAAIAPGSTLRPADEKFARGLVAASARDSIDRFSEALAIDPTHYFARSARALTCLLIDDRETSTIDAAVLAATIPSDRMVIAFRLRDASSRDDNEAFAAALHDARDVFPPNQLSALATSAQLVRSTESLFVAATRGDNYSDTWTKSLVQLTKALSMPQPESGETEPLLGPVGIRLAWAEESVAHLKRYCGAFMLGDDDEVFASVDALARASSSRAALLILAVQLGRLGHEYADTRVHTWEAALAYYLDTPSIELTCLVGLAAARVDLWTDYSTKENRDAAVDALNALCCREDLSPHLYARMTSWARQLRHGPLGYLLADRWLRATPDDPSPLQMKAMIAADLGHWNMVLKTVVTAQQLIEKSGDENRLAWLEAVEERALAKLQR